MPDRQKTIHDAADALVAALWEDVEALATETGKGALPATVTLARPFLRAALGRVEGLTLAVDRRLSVYHVSAMFWDLDNGADNAELVISTDDEGESVQVHGLQACLEQLCIWIAELHEGEELSDDAHMVHVVARVPTLKTAMVRGHGTAAFRITYTADGVDMLCHATVRRPDAMEAED